MTHKNFLDGIRNLVANHETDKAIQQLRLLLENSPLLDEAILQSTRFQDIRKQIRHGTVSREDASLAQNQINAALLGLLREIEAQSEEPSIREEMNKAIVILNSKNVVVGSDIKAGGDVHIGDKNTITSQNAEKIYNIDKIDKANFS